jgi:3',5'-cyclic AMP phosphodiesterase CpdA
VSGSYDRAMSPPAPSLLAIGDLHITYPENRRVIEALRPPSPGDWLIVCGDVSELSADLEWALGVLRERFATVIWVPGNHDLWTVPEDPVQLRGVARYLHLVEICRRHGVLTPEDPYPIWEGPGGPVAVAPLFVLYDYSFGSNIAPTAARALALAHAAGVVCSDEVVLFPDPFSSRAAWCEERVRTTEPRLRALDPELPTVLVNHFPLVRAPTQVLRHPEFAQWCGTDLTADWHVRFRARAAVYGHLHIPRTTVYDGVPFVEVSLGYPREWHRRRVGRPALRQILPFEGGVS